MRDIFKRALFCAVFLTSISIGFAQNVTKVGVSTTMEATWDNLILHSYGIEVDKSFSKHWGFETGLNYKKYVYDFMDINYISIPLAARFYSRVVNVSLGADASFYDNLKLNNNLTYNNPVVLDPFRLSFFTTLSKEFSIGSKFIIEPGLKFNFFNPVTEAEQNLGIGVKLKYKL